MKLIRSLTAIFLLVASAGSLNAGTPGIQDNAGFFSESARADAARNIAELQRSMKKDILVETYKEVPADIRQGVNLQDKAALDHMFENWSVQLARRQGVNGVHILIVRDPAHLQVSVGNETQKQAFTLGNRAELVQLMRSRLHEKNYDSALREGVSFICTTIKAHAPSRLHVTTQNAPGWEHATQRDSGFGWLPAVIVLLLVFWVVRGIFHAVTGGFGGAVGGGMMPGYSGGGFFRNMFGSMFGAAAGMWLYDSFFGSHSFGAPSNDQSFHNDDSGFSGQDTDYSSSGGSYGDDSGGGGFGGGDVGGGDSGGGDF